MEWDLPPLDDEQRKLFHAIFSEWFAGASEADYIQLDVARERYAPGQVCSMITLVRGCFAQPQLRSELPQTLTRLLRERNWPRPTVAAKSA